MGAETFDDAGALLLRDDLVLLQTADIISPVSDDAYVFGQVAAANALSDIYAMGGVPVSALNLAFFPARMPRESQRDILRGAADKCGEAGAAVIGGHTVEDREVKFGLSVSGTCKPADLLRNTGAQAGDLLVLTKPVGTGLLLTALQKGWLGERDLRPCHEQMAALNDVASRQALAHGAHAATDVTGFGLGGHAAEMAHGSGVRLCLHIGAIPRYPEVEALLRRGARTAITGDNRRAVVDLIPPDENPADEALALLADPQTSGGLLVSLPAAAADSYVALLHNSGVEHAAIVGEVLDASGAAIVLR